MKKWTNQWRALWHPDMYHGWRKKRNYFEGWYIKLVDPAGLASIAFIPGISMNANGEQKAFIQVLDGLEAKSYYYDFDSEDFHPSDREFSLNIGPNVFSHQGLKVDLPEFKGQIDFGELTPWPANNYGPGVMGWYSFVPFMQCYHGVVSMDHQLSGHLTIKGETIGFDGGQGYLEKDWGRSFPKAWIWLQTNHFINSPGTSIMFSIAHIPWLTGAFIGFLSGFYFKGKVYDFTTYNKAKVSIDLLEHGVKIIMKKKDLTLEVIAQQAEGADLKSPLSGDMLGKVNESMKASVTVRFSEQGKTLFEGTGTHAGMEMAGPLDVLINTS